MKKTITISAFALLTIFSCQNDSELESNSVQKQTSTAADNSSSNSSLWQMTTSTATAAKLLSFDNFDGTTLNSANWTVIVDTKTPEDAMDIRYWKNVASNAYLDGNGKLVLKSTKFDINTIHTGRLESRGKTFDKTYGYIEVSMKICDPASTNVQSSFWFYSKGDKPGLDGLDGAEIDIFESTNGLDRYPSTIHIDSYAAHRPITGSFTGSTNGYHTYGLEWQKNYIRIYFDRKVVKNLTAEGQPELIFRNGDLYRENPYNWIPTVNEYAILSVAPAWGNAAKGLSTKPAGTSTYTYVDYIKWYDKKPF